MPVVTVSNIPPHARLRSDVNDPYGNLVAKANTEVDRMLITRLVAAKVYEVDVVAAGEWGLLPDSVMRVRAAYDERVRLIEDDSSALGGAFREMTLRMLVARERAEQGPEDAPELIEPDFDEVLGKMKHG